MLCKRMQALIGRAGACRSPAATGVGSAYRVLLPTAPLTLLPNADHVLSSLRHAGTSSATQQKKQQRGGSVPRAASATKRKQSTKKKQHQSNKAPATVSHSWNAVSHSWNVQDKEAAIRRAASVAFAEEGGARSVLGMDRARPYASHASAFFAARSTHSNGAPEYGSNTTSADHVGRGITTESHLGETNRRPGSI